MTPRVRAAWPHLRAGFVAFHFAAMLLLAFPAPVGGLNRSAWSDPTVEAEMSGWAARFGMATKEFEDRLYAFALGYMSVRERVLRPFQRYADVTGTEQPWRMFIAPHRFPSKFRIETNPRLPPYDEWALLFEERDPEHAWHASYFAQERVRSELFRMSWPEYAVDAKRHCDYLAKQVFAEQPLVLAVQCRFYKAASPSPEQVLAGDEPAGTWIQRRIVNRPAP